MVHAELRALSRSTAAVRTLGPGCLLGPGSALGWIIDRVTTDKAVRNPRSQRLVQSTRSHLPSIASERLGT